MKLQRVAALAESPCKSGIATTKFAVACYSAKLAGIDNAEAKLRPRHPYEEAPEAGKKAVREGMAAAAEIEERLQREAAASSS